MKKVISILFFFVIFCDKINAQIIKHISWEFTSSNPKPKVGETIVLNFKGKIKSGWHLYSNNFKIAKEGPNEFIINFNKTADYQIVGEPKAIGDFKKINEYFKVNVRYFSKNCIFQQKVKILKKNAIITGNYEGQVCTDADGTCSQNIGQFTFQL